MPADATRTSALIGLGLACLVAGDAAPAPLPEVDLQLILAVDVSRSMDAAEHRIQRRGYVAAFRDAEIARAIASGPLRRIAVAYFEWAGPLHQSVAVPWTVIASGADAEAFAYALAEQPILSESSTSISAALAFAERIFPVSGVRSFRRAVDVSGDGPNNAGPPLAPVRQRLVAAGVTINGLSIEVGVGDHAGVAGYYADAVIGGPGAFFVPVTRKVAIGEAILHKLVREITWPALASGPAPGEWRRRVAYGLAYAVDR